MPEVNIKILGCIDRDDIEQICCDHDIDIDIDYVNDCIVSCSDERFLQGVIAALMHSL